MSKIDMVLLAPACLGVVSLIRYLAYLVFAWHVSRVHGVAGLEALRFVARPSLGSPTAPEVATSAADASPAAVLDTRSK
jgi:hypothetical protein